MNYLVINAIGQNRPGISYQLFHLTTQLGCNIVDSKIALLGGEFSLMMLISGNHTQITNAEAQLPVFGVKHQLLTTMKRTTVPQVRHCTYKIDAIIESTDRTGIIEHFTQFYASRYIDLEALNARILSKSTEETMVTFQVTGTAYVDDSCNLTQLQEDFYNMCKAQSLQGKLNFVKVSTEPK